MYFFNLTEQHSKFLLHTLQVLYVCTLCDSTNINTTISSVLCRGFKNLSYTIHL